jgi:hypothetical protein
MASEEIVCFEYDDAQLEAAALKKMRSLTSTRLYFAEN